MPLQISNFNWVVDGSATRICKVTMTYQFEVGEGAAREIANTSIAMTFVQSHDEDDSYDEIAAAIKNFAETMFEEAADEAAV